MNNYTDEQLKRALAKMLPEKVDYLDSVGLVHIERTGKNNVAVLYKKPVLETELLHLCQLIQDSLTPENRTRYMGYRLTLSDRWQDHATALAKTLDIEIV